MRRRTFLSVAGLAALSGCAAGYQGTPTATPAPDDVPIAELGTPADICEEELKPGLILAIDEPAFADDWSGVENDRYPGGLEDDAVVVGLTDGAQARAYPLRVLKFHEIVNDDFGGPVAVTYCPLCDSGLVAERRVAGEETLFRVSGLLWNPPDLAARDRKDDGSVFGVTHGDLNADVQTSGNLVMVDDATRSRWSQLLAQAICGPRRGEELSIVASTTARWGDWTTEHPDTDVLLPPPHSGKVLDTNG